MKSMFSRFEFLKDYGKRRLSSIQAVPQWATGVNHVSDEVVLNFEDGMQLVVTSGFEDVETFFGIDEDAVFSIRECRNHIAKSNLDGLEMATVLVGEKPQSIEVFFDEISPEDKSETCVFPVALFIRTPLRSIGICRDMINGTWLDAEFRNATSEMVFPSILKHLVASLSRVP